MKTSRGTLHEGEPHPAVDSVKEYMNTLSANDLLLWKDALASAAISGNRLAEVCLETLDRLMRAEPVSNRYLLGLAWTIRERKDHR